jgi:hypothetical protein
MVKTSISGYAKTSRTYAPCSSFRLGILKSEAEIAEVHCEAVAHRNFKGKRGLTGERYQGIYQSDLCHVTRTQGGSCHLPLCVAVYYPYLLIVHGNLVPSFLYCVGLSKTTGICHIRKMQKYRPRTSTYQ